MGKKNKDFSDADHTEHQCNKANEASVDEEKSGFWGTLFATGEDAENSNEFVATDFSDTYATSKLAYINFTPTHTSAGTIRFKGFLTQLSDNFKTQWSGTPAYGRMDEIKTFQNTTRNISVGFSAPAFDLAESKRNLAKVSALMRMLYPVYGNGPGDSATSISKAPLIRVEFANLISSAVSAAGNGGLLGTVDGFTFAPNLEHGFFDPTESYLFPKTINVSFNLTVLHEHIAGWTGDNKWAADTADHFPYIAISEPTEVPEPAAEGAEDDGTTDEDKEATFWQNLNPNHEGGWMNRIVFDDNDGV